jgi:hypothetical protein
MTIIAISPTTFATVDLYRDIHKGIRAELFAITAAAGSIDPSSPSDRAALADHIMSVAHVLESHAHHEDAVIDPVLALHLPDLAEEITEDHERLEARFSRIGELAAAVVDAPQTELQRLTRTLYLDLSSFTGTYLAHQDLEERIVMPELERMIGVEQVLELHGAIVGSIPPDEMARSLAFMLPAMNVDDRSEMLDGMRMAAPQEAFDAVVGLARSVLLPADYSALADRLDIA